MDDADEFIKAVRSTADDMIVGSENLCNLLAWADEHVRLANVPVEQRAISQLAYIFLAFASNLNLSVAFTLDTALDFACTLELEFAQTLTRALAHTRAIQYEYDAARTRDRTINLTFQLILARVYPLIRYIDLEQVGNPIQTLSNTLDFNLARELAYMTGIKVGVDYGLYYIWRYARLFANKHLERTDSNWQDAMQQLPSLIDETVMLASEAELYDLAQQLVSQSLPLPSSEVQAWRKYANTLSSLLEKERDLGHAWSFTELEVDKLNKYFYANELLIQCLKVAAVSDRQGVLNGLLLPPKVEQASKPTG